MAFRTVMCALLALVLSANGVAFGQDRPDRGPRGRQRQAEPGGVRAGPVGPHADEVRRPGRRVGPERGPVQGRRDDRRRDEWQRHDVPDREMRREGWGGGPDRGFRRGGRLPAEYRSRHYVVEDWRGHRLSAPPRGHHWVQVGGDYLLVAIATGVILQLLLGQ